MRHEFWQHLTTGAVRKVEISNAGSITGISEELRYSDYADMDACDLPCTESDAEWTLENMAEFWVIKG